MEACEKSGWNNPDYLTTLAAALAEAANFGGAMLRQEQALNLLPRGDPREKDYREHWRMYAKQTRLGEKQKAK